MSFIASIPFHLNIATNYFIILTIILSLRILVEEPSGDIIEETVEKKTTSVSSVVKEKIEDTSRESGSVVTTTTSTEVVLDPTQLAEFASKGMEVLDDSLAR